MNIHDQLALIDQDRQKKASLKQRLLGETDRAFDALMQGVDKADPQCLKLYFAYTHGQPGKARETQLFPSLKNVPVLLKPGVIQNMVATGECTVEEAKILMGLVATEIDSTSLQTIHHFLHRLETEPVDRVIAEMLPRLRALEGTSNDIDDDDDLEFLK